MRPAHAVLAPRRRWERLPVLLRQAPRPRPLLVPQARDGRTSSFLITEHFLHIQWTDGLATETAFCLLLALP